MLTSGCAFKFGVFIDANIHEFSLSEIRKPTKNWAGGCLDDYYGIFFYTHDSRAFLDN